MWDAYSGGATITGLKCGDFQMKAEIRSGSSQTATHTGAYNYTVIPDIVGDTAFVQNVATGKYIDLEQVNYVPTDIVQQWSFHGGTQSQWIFELGGSGYFKIKSVKTGKYIGVDSSDTSKVKQYSTVTDYTLWKIGETSSRNYKFACKALESSGKVLCAPTITSGDGADLTMLVYGDNSSYGDEWNVYSVSYIATVNNFYDKGYYIRYGESESVSHNEIENYNFAVSQVYLKLFGLLIYSNGAQYYNSPIDQCKGTVSSSNIDTMCSHSGTAHTDRSNVISSLKSYCAGNNTTTNVLWSGHKIKSIASSGNVNFNRSCSSGYYLYILEISMSYNRTIHSQGVLLHELNHQYGAKDHYHEEISPGVCKFADVCSTCGANPRPATCIMNNSRQNINSSQIICNECMQDIFIHLEDHH